MSTLDHFIAFGTSSYGLERILRGVEAFSQILISYPLLLAAVRPLIPLIVPSHSSLVLSLALLRQKLGLTRRTIRFFRFLGSFQSGYTLYTAPSPSGGRGIDVWLDISCKSCLGVYGLLETITILDVAKVDGLTIWGVEQSGELNRQGQIFWLIALYINVLSSLWKLLGIFAHKPVPQDGKGFGTVEGALKAAPTENEKDASAAALEPVKPEETLSKGEELDRERTRLRAIVKKRKEERRAWIRSVVARAKKLGWAVLTSCLDSVLPAKAVGWIDVHDGLVGVIMLSTSILTGMDIWGDMKEKQ